MVSSKHVESIGGPNQPICACRVEHSILNAVRRKSDSGNARVFHNLVFTSATKQFQLTSCTRAFDRRRLQHTEWGFPVTEGQFFANSVLRNQGLVVEGKPIVSTVVGTGGWLLR